MDINEELAFELLGGGHDLSMLVTHCGFSSLRAAREFELRYETRAAVDQLRRERIARIRGAAMSKLEKALECEDGDKRALLTAIRTGLEGAGLLGKATAPPARRVNELSSAELKELIASPERVIEDTKHNHFASRS